MKTSQVVGLLTCMAGGGLVGMGLKGQSLDLFLVAALGVMLAQLGALMMTDREAT